MKLHNTLTRQTETFTPQSANKVTFYSCGPTVYDYYHIGNLRNAVFNDTLKRTLVQNGYDVKHVMNITDVGHLVSDADEGEDKLEKGAAREGKTVQQVAQHYTEAFKNDMQALNVIAPNAYKSKVYDDTYARATEFIEQQIAMVRQLIDKGYAYVTTQAVYFEVSKLKDYGILSGQKLADKEVGVRKDVVTDPDKRSPHDFAVWFFAVNHFANHSMQWPSPWGNGFPGWHLECSAIVHHTLGDPIDIHTGGIDHIGTHHPNEMAQTQAAFGNNLAKYWVHNEFILVDGAKMSKSKNNSYTLSDVTARGYDPLHLRLLYLQAHYRSELNFSWQNLDAAKNRLVKLRAFADLRWQPLDQPGIGADTYTNVAQSITDCLSDDLNTPNALASLSQFIDATKYLPNADITCFNSLLASIDAMLGLDLLKTKDITDLQKNSIRQWQELRQQSNYQEADKLRESLLTQGIQVNATNYGVLWSRV